VGVFLALWLLFSPLNRAHAEDPAQSEQVIVSPAQQAVNTALSTATTEVQQAIAATSSTTTQVSQAQTELSQAQTAVSEISSAVTTAQTEVNNIQDATNTINAIDILSSPVDQSSSIIVDAKQTIVDATNAIANLNTQISEAQIEITQTNTARSAAVSAQSNAQTQLTEANIAIDNAQNAVNALQATIGNSTNVLAGVDDAGVQMNLPFGLLMGGTLYNNVFVGSNATITFGTNEGWIYYTTPNSPSISIAGWDWTTWSTGTGITYSTTANTLDIAWDVRPYPQMDASTQMVQIRFNADVNPSNGAWMANVSATGPFSSGARFNYRETTNGTITQIIDTNSGAGFNGQISQGPSFTPTIDPNIAPIQAAVDAANATIAQLNSSLTPVVTQNAANQSAINSISTTSLTSTVNSAITTTNNLSSSLQINSENLINSINNNIPTPAPIVSEPVIDGTTVTIAPELPEGYTANTWFYQVISVDPNAENPYEGQTLNTDGAPESIQLTGLTEGATYIIRIANWSGPTSQYTETTVSIPSSSSGNLIAGGGSSNLDGDAQTPPTDTTPDPGTDTGGDTTPDTPDNPDDGGSSEDNGSQDTDKPESDNSSSNDEQGNNPEENQGTDNSSQNNDTITTEDIQNVVEEFLNDGTLTLEEKSQIADLLIKAVGENPISAADIAAAGLEFRDLPPATPVEVRTDINGNPVVITAEVASALLTLESPAAFIGGIAACINPDEAIEGLTEEQKCELFKALANIGADMSPQERQKAKEILVAAILVGQVILGSSILRIRG